MKALLIALSLAAATSAPAFAGCAQSLQELDAAMTAAVIAPDSKAQLQDMRSQAEKLCSAGNDKEASDVIAEAEALLAAQAQ